MDHETLEDIVLAGINTVRYQTRVSPEAHRLELMPRGASTTVVILTSSTPIEAAIGDLLDPAMKTGPEWSDTKYLAARTPVGPENAERVHSTFHKLWSQAVGTDGYVKDDWAVLNAALRLAGYEV